MPKTSLHAFKAKDTRFVADWLKSKGLHKLFSVFEGIQEPFLLSLAHTQLPEHNKSYRKVSQGWGHLITWNGPMMGHSNSFSASGGGNLNKNFAKNTNDRGLPRGGMLKLRFDWYITLKMLLFFCDFRVAFRGPGDEKEKFEANVTQFFAMLNGVWCCCYVACQYIRRNFV